MEKMKPVELLKQELEKWEKALRKSKQFFEEKRITEEEHKTHIKNLTSKISSYKHTIEILKDNA